MWPHQVQPGETWDSIAEKYGVSLQQLQHVNPHQSNPLAPNSIVYVPATAASGMPQGAAPGYAGAPSYGAAPGADMTQGYGQPTIPQAPGAIVENGYGPHTHNPYRLQGGTWFAEADDNDPYLRFEEQDGSARDTRSTPNAAESGTAAIPQQDDEGWSAPFTIDLSED